MVSCKQYIRTEEAEHIYYQTHVISYEKGDEEINDDNKSATDEGSSSFLRLITREANMTPTIKARKDNLINLIPTKAKPRTIVFKKKEEEKMTAP